MISYRTEPEPDSYRRFGDPGSEERERERNLGLLGLRDSDAAAPAFQMSTQILAPVLARRRTFGPNSGIS